MEPDYLENFRNNLYKIRCRRKISQQALSELCGFGVNAISSIENGTREPKLTEMCIIADHFEIRMDDLLGREL